MPIKKRLSVTYKSRLPLTGDAVQQVVTDAIQALNALLGDDLSVSVVLARPGSDGVNILTNELDYGVLTSQLQSIVNNRNKLGPVNARKCG